MTPNQPMQLSSLQTPCLVLDRQIMARNIESMHERLRAAGVPLRPHLKTSKCVEIARLLVAGQPGGIAVSTLAEAAHFAAAGFHDILYAVVITPDKLPRAAALRKAGVALTLLLDDLETAELVGAGAVGMQTNFDVLLEIDADGHRSGASAESRLLIPLARAINAVDGLDLRGILTHAGSAYDCRTLDCVAEVAELERRTMAEAADSLRAAGLDIAQVSLGSTPTALAARNYGGATEIRAGVFPFNDLMQAGIGVCRTADIAVSVLCTVISHYPAKGRVIVDAGWTALSHEAQPHGGMAIFGRVCNVQGQIIEDLAMTMLNQEHGIITRPSGNAIDAAMLPIGSKLRVLPVHACATAAAHSGYHLLNERGEVCDFWSRLGGWH